MKQDRLNIESILDYYDEPILFLARDDYDTLYLCLIGNEQYEYIATKIKKKQLNDLLSSTIDVRSIFCENWITNNRFGITVKDDLLLKYDLDLLSIPDDILPDPGYYVKSEDMENYTISVPKKDGIFFHNLIKRFGWIAM